MKKFFLLLLTISTLNANAAIISISTDKDVYNVGETVTATVNAKNLIESGIQTYFYGYDILLMLNNPLISFDPASITDLGSLGAQSVTFTMASNPSTVSASGVEFFLARMDPFFPGAKFTQEGRGMVSLFSFELVALSAGVVELSNIIASLSDGLGGNVPDVSTQSTRFAIAEVSAPTTLALSILALAGVMFTRKRANS
ncbi:hypothetical protein [Alteromonas gracilis]|uniref:hypothetical protein n=1 Tax=Alteromonas gracilis TaxID=1479524 RepID=UPI0037364FF6